MQQFHCAETNYDELPEGFAKFNNCDHLCVNVPDKICTVSLVLSNGRQITLGFMPYGGHPEPQVCDIVVHNSGKTVKNGQKDVPVMEFSARCGPTGNSVYVGKATDKEPTTCICMSLRKSV